MDCSGSMSLGWARVGLGEEIGDSPNEGGGGGAGGAKSPGPGLNGARAFRATPFISH